MTLSPADRALIESLVFDPSLTPKYEMLKSCLVWADEMPVGISPDGYEYVSDLLAVRGFIHRGVPTENWGIGPAPYLRVWDDAVGSGLTWIGFRRLPLSTQDRRFLDEQIAGDTVEGFRS
jgi:hypothetical protein